MTISQSTALSRRQVLGAGATAGAVGLLGLTGCSSGSGGSTSSGPIRLLANGADYVKGQFAYGQVQQFMKAHPGPKVQVVSAGQNVQQLFYSQAASGDLPDMLFNGGQIDLATMIAHGWALSLHDLGIDIASRFPADIWVEGVTVDKGEIYSWTPFVQGGGSLFQYNTKMMAQAGLDPHKPPQTWDELIYMSERIHKKLPDVYGLAVPLKVPAGFNYLANCTQNLHPAVVTGFDYHTGRYAHDTRYNEVVPLLLRLKKTQTLHPNSLSLDASQSDGYFNTGRVAFSLSGAWIANVNEIRHFTDYGVAPSPIINGSGHWLEYNQAATASYYVTSKTKDRARVKALVDWLTSPEQLKQWVTQGYRTAADPTLTAKYAPNEQLKTLSGLQQQMISPPIANTDPVAFAAKQAEAALPAPRQDWWQVIQGAYAGKVSDWKSVLAQVNKQYNDTFDQALKKAHAPRSKFITASWNGRTNYPVDAAHVK